MGWQYSRPDNAIIKADNKTELPLNPGVIMRGDLTRRNDARDLTIEKAMLTSLNSVIEGGYTAKEYVVAPRNEH